MVIYRCTATRKLPASSPENLGRCYLEIDRLDKEKVDIALLDASMQVIDRGNFEMKDSGVLMSTQELEDTAKPNGNWRFYILFKKETGNAEYAVVINAESTSHLLMTVTGYIAQGLMPALNSMEEELE